MLTGMKHRQSLDIDGDIVSSLKTSLVAAFLSPLEKLIQNRPFLSSYVLPRRRKYGVSDVNKRPKGTRQTARQC